MRRPTLTRRQERIVEALIKEHYPTNMKRDTLKIINAELDKHGVDITAGMMTHRAKKLGVYIAREHISEIRSTIASRPRGQYRQREKPPKPAPPVNIQPRTFSASIDPEEAMRLAMEGAVPSRSRWK